MKAARWTWFAAILGALLVLPPVRAGDGTPRVRASALPAVPLVEAQRDGQAVNFDLVFDNPGDTALELRALEMTRHDADGRFAGQRRLDRNGDATTMSVATLANRILPAAGRLVVFNPFPRFPPGDFVGDLRFVAVFGAVGDARGQGAGAAESRVELEVRPRAPATSSLLHLPLSGEVFVHDGHDLLSHHRRLDITGAMTTHFGIRANFMRYAHDFVVTDRHGRLYRTDGATPQDWYGYGAPVLSAAAGVVREAVDGMADNRKGGPPPFGQAELMRNLKLFLGNHVLVKHDDGRHAVYAHLKQGSVAVAPGQRVAAGAVLGGMGMSGDAFLVHLHFQMQSGPAFDEGLPAVFRGVSVRTGRGWSPAFNGPVDSGDVVRSVLRAR